MITLEQLRRDINFYSPSNDGAYNTRMYHKMPNTEVIDRNNFVLAKCSKRVVLDVGCCGDFHNAIHEVAKKAYGIDRMICKTPNFIQWDFDLMGGKFPVIEDNIQLVFCGEIMEHLSNPGLFLVGLKQFQCPVIFTVPNAFSAIHPQHIRRMVEHVNIEHVAFYSWHTFKTLIERFNYVTDEFYWYDAPKQVSPQGFNEGCVFVTHHGS